MATFSEALEYLKANGTVKREIVKSDMVILMYKNRLYYNVGGVRVPYKPSNKDLTTDDWLIFDETKLLVDNPVSNYSDKGLTADEIFKILRENKVGHTKAHYIKNELLSLLQ